MGYSIFSHGLLHLVGWKTNGRRRMVLINLQKAFDIINHKILLQKTYSVGFSANQLLGFLVWVVPAYQFSSEYQKWTLQCCKYQRQSSTTFDRVYFTGGVPPLASFQVSIKNELSNVANTNGRVAQHSTEFTLLGEFSH